MAGSRDHVVARGVLRHERRGAGLQGGEQVLVAGVHGQHDEAHVGALGAQRLDDVEPAAVGQADVADGDVGLELGGVTHGLTDGRAFCHDREVGVAVEGPTQTLTDQVVVIDEQHGVGHGFLQLTGRGEGTSAGSRTAETAVPPPGRLAMVSTALMRPARSFMMCRP